MKLDDLKYLPILTGNAFHINGKGRQVQEIAEIKLKPHKNRRIISENSTGYVVGLIKPRFDVNEMNGRISESRLFDEEYKLVWCNYTKELKNGIVIPFETQDNLICAELSLLKYNSLKKLKTK